jgi:YgiT-type zinc finger domain-containing protein
MTCPNCGSEEIKESTFIETFDKKFDELYLTEIVYSWCDTCGHMFRKTGQELIKKTFYLR